MVVENVKQTSQRLVDSSRVISDGSGGRTATVIGLPTAWPTAGPIWFPEIGEL